MNGLIIHTFLMYQITIQIENKTLSIYATKWNKIFVGCLYNRIDSIW